MADRTYNCYGWRPDTPDQRDKKLSMPRLLTTEFPQSMDLRPHCPPIWDQGQLGSCTAQAISAALQFEAIKSKQFDANVVRSRLFIYWYERFLENSINTDAGAEIRDGIKAVATVGACNESLWWYNATKFMVKPSKKCFDNAKKYAAIKYYRVPQTHTYIRGCLAEGFPIILGVTCYDSFLSDAAALTGIIPMPGLHESVQGGHAILIVGYDDEKQLYIFRNSWGTGWGDKGYGYIPYAYIENSDLTDDLWTVRDAL